MAQTIIGVNDPLAVKKYGSFLSVDVGRTSYFNKKFMGVGVAAQTPIQRLENLENDAGDTITYDLVMALKMAGIEGDEILRGKEENLSLYTDSVSIDQLRGGVNTGGKMTRKRTLHDLRKIARARESEWWARIFDEMFFIYLSGARGVNDDFNTPLNFTGRAGNPLVAPDSQHLMYGGAATSKATLTTADKMSLKLVDRLVARASMMGGGTAGIPSIEPMMIEGEERYVLVMNPWQAYDLRTNSSNGEWLDVQKAAAAAEGRKNPIFTGNMGMHNDVVLQQHKAIIRLGGYGAGANVDAARALFMGRQAGVVAFGSAGDGLKFDWTEETEDRGNQLVITTASIFGIKKTAFVIDGVSRDFGVIAVDTAVADPG